MTPADILQLVSIVIEAGACILSIALAVQKKLVFGWLFALTFGIYVIFDLARVTGSGVPDTSLAAAFLVASLSAIVALWLIYQKK